MPLVRHMEAIWTPARQLRLTMARLTTALLTMPPLPMPALPMPPPPMAPLTTAASHPRAPAVRYGCQASKRCFAAAYGLDDEAQLAWRELLDEMAGCRFEGSRGDVMLAEAIIDRLPPDKSTWLSALCSSSQPQSAVVVALRALKFVDIGL